jgi:hypothetical protein
MKNAIKGKVHPTHAMKAKRGSGGIVPLILNLYIRWRRQVSFASRLLYSRRNRTQYHWTEGWVDPRAGLHVVGKRKSLYPPQFNFGLSSP